MPPLPSLTSATVETILARIPTLTIGVLGDLFLDRYLDVDATLTEPSLETGLDAYQVVRVRAYPGAAGTVINNLASLGVGCIRPFAIIGDDGEGHELRQALETLPAVDRGGILSWPGRRTPTYTKPMLCEPRRTPRELNRLDIHNRTVLPEEAEERLLFLVEGAWSSLDGLVVLDQISLPDCGVVTARIRRRLAELGRNARPWILADSRERIASFTGVCLKPNQRECLRAVAGASGLADALGQLLRATGKPVFCTQGEQGIIVAEPAVKEPWPVVPGYPVTGPTDPVGAGDSTSAGIICALAAGLEPAQAAAFGNLVASITVAQIGTTGTASPEQVRQRWREVDGTQK